MIHRNQLEFASGRVGIVHAVVWLVAGLLVPTLGCRSSRGTQPDDAKPRTGVPARKLKTTSPTHDLVPVANLADHSPALMFEVSPMGERVATIESPSNRLCLVRVRATGDQAEQYRSNIACETRALAFSPDGSQLAVATRDKLELIDIASRKVAGSLPLSLNDLAWGRFGLVALRLGEIVIVEPSSGATRTLGRGQFLARNGERFAAASVVEHGREYPTEGGHYWTVDRVALEAVDIGSSKRVPLPIPDAGGQVWFATGGAIVVHGLYNVYRFSAGGTPEPPLEVGFGATGGTISPDGRLYVVVGDDHMKVIDLVEGAIVADLQIRKLVGSLSFDSRGVRLLGNVEGDGWMAWDLVPRDRGDVQKQPDH